jgi:HlyD family secretion protein
MIGLVVLAFGLATWGALFFFRSRDSGVVVLQGNIDVRQLNLSFKVAGRIAEMRIDEGDRVDAGKIVAVLDKSYFADDVRLARARVAAQTAILARLVNGTRPEEVAQARDMVADRESAVALAQITLERKAELAEKGFTPHQQHDEATATAGQALAALKSAQETLKLAEIGPRSEDIDAAKAQLEGENAALVQAERRLTDSDLIAPSGGVILTRVREPGAIVGAGETVYAITITSPVWVRSYVAEPELGRIQPGMVVEVRTDSGKTYSGQIGFISPVAEFTPKSVETKELRTSLVYRLRVVVNGDTNGLLQGMPVTVETTVKRKP